MNVTINKCHGGYSVECFNEDDHIFVTLPDAFEFVREYFNDGKNRLRKACANSINE